MILSAQSIRRRVESGDLIIQPFHERTRVHGRTFGLSACGYDVRLKQTIWLWPFWGRIASIVEYLGLPNDLRGRIENKSTNARLFVDGSQVTNIEPGWRGWLTIELTRDRPWPIRLRAGTPIVQIVFEELDEPTEQPYCEADKYQDQPDRPVAAILEKK